MLILVREQFQYLWRLGSYGQLFAFFAFPIRQVAAKFLWIRILDFGIR